MSGVFWLALPATAAAILTQLYRPIDQYFVGGLSVEAQAAVGSTTFVTIGLTSTFLLISAGVGPLVARALGAGDRQAVRRSLGAGIAGMALLALAVAIGGGFGATWVADQLGLSGKTAEYCAIYLRALTLTGAPLAFAPLVNAAFHGSGDTRAPFWLQVVAVGLIAIGNPFLMFRCGLGIAGSAYATTFGELVAVAVGLAILVRRFDVRWIDIWPGFELLRAVRIGYPVALATGIYALVYLTMIRTSISPLGPAVNAGLGIGFSALEAITWPMYLGGSTAVASIVGRCLGAGRVDLAWRAIRVAAAPVVGLGASAGVVFYVFGPVLVGIFAADDDALREGIRYATILAFSQPFVALEAFAEGVLAGAGDSRRLFWSTVPFNLLRVPLAYWLAIHLGYGAAGVWWAINLTSCAKATAKSLAVWHGGWTTLKL